MSLSWKKVFITMLCSVMVVTGIFVLPTVTRAAQYFTPQNVRTADETTAGQTVTIVGQLIEVGNTLVRPTTILLRSNEKDYLVNVNANTVTMNKKGQFAFLSDAIVGDWFRVVGKVTSDETAIDASVLVNLSLTAGIKHQPGVITALDQASGIITVQYRSKEYQIQVTEKTHIVVAGKTATIGDLKVGDTIFARGLKSTATSILQAKIILVLQRGNATYVQKKVDLLKGQLVEITSNTAPTTLQMKTADGTVYTINVTETTPILRRYGGRAELAELIQGDSLAIVGKKVDATTYTALMIKDNSIWLVSTKGVAGTITAINVDKKQFDLLWESGTYRVDLSDATKIVVSSESGLINPATIADLRVGMLVRGRGIKNAKYSVIQALLVLAWSEKS